MTDLDRKEAEIEIVYCTSSLRDIVRTCRDRRTLDRILESIGRIRTDAAKQQRQLYYESLEMQRTEALEMTAEIAATQADENDVDLKSEIV
jgi:hypothetical protein